MPTMTVKNYDDGSKLVLTTDSSISSYGLPVLRYLDINDSSPYDDMGPSDVLPVDIEGQEVYDLFGPRMAGDVVEANTYDQDEEVQSLAKAFLSQRP